MMTQLDILLAVKDGETYLVETINSLLSQTALSRGCCEIRFVIVDDGSSDGTPEILANYHDNDPRFLIIRNDRSLGLPTSLNRGLEQCSAPLVARADADDLHSPDRLSKQIAFLEANPQVGVLGTSFNRIALSGEVIGTVRPPFDHDTIYARQNFTNSLLHPSVVFRTDLVRTVGGYDTIYRTAQDSDLWVRLRDRTKFANLQEVLVNYRVHPGSITGQRDEKGKQLSLSVSKRLLSAALGRSLDDEETAAVVALYQGFGQMPANAIKLGLPLLHRCLHEIARTAPETAMRHLRKEAAGALVRRMEAHLWTDRRIARALLASAIRLDVGCIKFTSALRSLLPHRSQRQVRI